MSRTYVYSVSTRGKKSHFWSGSSARMNAAAFPLNYFVKKWYDICLEAEVAEDEVLEDEEAKKDLTKE